MPEPSPQTHDRTHTTKGGGRVPPPVIALLSTVSFGLVVSGFILLERVPGRVFYDQELYHHPAINQFVAQWPNFDFWHYLSATTPGYHLLMAAVARYISPSIFTLQIASLAISLVLVWVFSLAVARRTAPLLALAACMPFLFSPYIVGSAAWLLPDNLGWLGVLCTLLIALRQRATTPWLILGGVVLLALVFVRQVHLWAAGLLVASAWLSDEENPTFFRALFWNLPAQAGRTAIAIAAAIPAIVLVALFWRYWGGPVPPVFQAWFYNRNPSASAFVLALIGMWSIPFALTWLPHLYDCWRTQRAWLIGACVASLAYLLAVPTTNDYDSGRRTGLWNHADILSTFGHSSVLVVGLGLLGTTALAGLLFAVPMRQRIIFLAAIVGLAAANTANHDLFQRYVDPFVLMLLALMTASAQQTSEPSTADTPGAPRRAAQKEEVIRAAGPLVLAMMLAGLSIRSVMGRDKDGRFTSAHINDPPPPSRDPTGNDKAFPPCDKPRPPTPPGKHFWPWS